MSWLDGIAVVAGLAVTVGLIALLDPSLVRAARTWIGGRERRR